MATQAPPKGMSSRLLTMKFMQRAAASPHSSPATAGSEEQSAKRRKVSHSSSPQTGLASSVDRTAVQAALDEEERKRQEALSQHAAELGDARWILNVKDDRSLSTNRADAPLNVVRVGFAQIDSGDDPANQSGLSDTPGTRAQTIRRYNMKARSFGRHPSFRDPVVAAYNLP